MKKIISGYLLPMLIYDLNYNRRVKSEFYSLTGLGLKTIERIKG